jgi:hypothetical protein
MKQGVNFPFNPNRDMFFHGATFRNNLVPRTELKRSSPHSRGLLLTSAYFSSHP